VHGRQDAASSASTGGALSPRRSDVAEEDLPHWLKEEDGIKVYRDLPQSFNEDYHNLPPVFEATKALWHHYFADVEKNVLSPQVGFELTHASAPHRRISRLSYSPTCVLLTG
jgi:hypothetical protein